jgi:hypothetical protein
VDGFSDDLGKAVVKVVVFKQLAGAGRFAQPPVLRFDWSESPDLTAQS